MNTQLKKGIILAIAAAIISGFSVFINKIAESHWQSSNIYTAEKNIVAAIILTAIVVGFYKWREIKSLSKAQWLKLIVIGLVGGSIPFLLFFKGLALTHSSSAAFWNKTLFIWVAILAWPLLKEKLNRLQLVALGLLILGNLTLFWPKSLSVSRAEILILSATVIWAFEYILAKKFMQKISPEVLVWGRMNFGAIFLIAFLSINHEAAGLWPISVGQIPWLLIVGVSLFAYVIFWYGAIKKIPVTVAAAILTVASPITTLLNSIFDKKILPQNFWIITIVFIAAIAAIIIQSMKKYDITADKILR